MYFTIIIGLLCGLLTACGDKNLPTRSIEMASKGINGGALSNDGQYAVVGSIFHGGSFWRTSDGERIYNWNHSDKEDDRIIISADISTSNTHALTADAASIVLWDVDTGRATRFWTSPAEVLASQLSANGRYAILGLADHSAVIFDAIRGGIVRTLHHKGRVRSVDMSQNRQLAITGSEDQTATVWRLEDGQALFNINHKEDVQLVKLSHDGRYALSAAKYDRAELWDIPSQKSLGIIPLEKEQLRRGLRITAAEFSADGTSLLLGYPNRVVELRRLPSLTVIQSWTLPKRNQWQPSAAAVIDLAYDKHHDHYWAMSSDGFVHRMQ